MLFGLMGALALFLYGMQTMTGALERAAGDGLRRALARATRTPLLGALAGAAATAVLQSSSAVTAAVVGFTGARLVDLTGAVAVIFGANVGTTVTGQLLAFRLTDWLGPLLLAGLVLHLGAKRTRTRQAGLALFSFGLLLTGVDAMGAAMAPLAGSARFTALLALAAERPIIGLVLGAALTAAVQSSSAAVAVVQSLAPIAGLRAAVPMLLGCNIGTTVTALLAAAGSTADARRAALAHLIFNLTGALGCLALLGPFTRLTLALSPAGAEGARLAANAHTLFNLLCAALWLPMTGLMVRLVTWAVPEKKRAPSEEGACR